jgi:16S rRNA (cytosine1402-N4)-methyltransferase
MNQHEPFYHEPVLVKEVLEFLQPAPGKLYLDATFGGGGHTRAILKAEPEASVVALDWDQQALDINGPLVEEQFPGRVTLCWGSFAIADRILKRSDITQIDGALADFGTAQYQLKNKAGFSFQYDTPLDMRMSPAHGQLTAAALLNKGTEQKLREIFWSYGQEPQARKIAAAIIAQRVRKPFYTTFDLAHLVESIIPRTRGIHPATRVFQALRIFINRELENIRSFLPAAQRIIKPGGRLVAITFHSLEDHIVKHSFREQAQLGNLRVLTEQPIGPSDEERQRNPSARSAKVRAAEIVSK